MLFKTVTQPRFATTAGLACCAIGASVSLAQAPDEIDVGVCLEIESPVARLECFEVRTAEMLRIREAEDGAEERSNESAADAARPAADVASNEAAERVDQPVDEPVDRPVELSRAERRALRRAEDRQRQAEAAVAAAAAMAAAPTLIVAKVTSVREIEPDMLLITLDNGQVWRQNRSQRYALRIGAEVELRPSGWGQSYRLTDRNVGSFIQVIRRQ